MRLLFAGTPEPAAQVLVHLLAGREHTIAAVLTQPDRPAGRGRKISVSPVTAVAREQSLPVFQPTNLRAPEFVAELKALQVDCVVVVAYGRFIPADILDLPRHGWLNLHFSLLPAWRGAAPVQHAILHGDDQTGACVFRIDSGLDTGPVFGCTIEPVLTTDTSASLLSRLTEHGSHLLDQVLQRLDNGTAVCIPQDLEGVSLAPRITSQMTQLNWHNPALSLQRAVRAFSPVPGAWTTLAGTRIKILGIPRVEPTGILSPGLIRGAGEHVVVGTGSTPLVLDLVQPAGKAAMPANAWLRGLRDVESAVFT